MLNPLGAHLVGEGGERLTCFAIVSGASSQPRRSAISVGSSRQTVWSLLHDALHHLVGVQPNKRVVDGGPVRSEAGEEAVGAPRLEQGELVGDVPLQGVEGVDEGVDAVGEQLVGDGVHVHAGLGDAVEDLVGVGGVAGEAGLRLALFEEGGDGVRRQRVHGVRPDEGLDVMQLVVGGVLGAGARPEGALDAGLFLLEVDEPLALEDVLEHPVRLLSVGDGGAAEQGFQVVCAGVDALLKLGVDGGVDAAEEEGSDGGDAADVAARLGQLLQPGKVRLDDLPVGGKGEDEGDVDVDPLADELPDGGHAGGRRRNLDHGVGAFEHLEEAAGLLDRGFGVVRQVGADLEGGVAVGAAGAVVEGAQEIGDHANVVDGQRLVGLVDGCAPVGERAESVVVVGAAGDGLLENGGVRGEPGDAGVDETRQVAGDDEAAPHIVVPDGLAQASGLLDRVGHHAPLLFRRALVNRSRRRNHVGGA